MLGRRELTRYLVGAELKRTHADTAIGQLWWVLDPLLQMAVYYIFITIIFASSQPDYPLFIFVAILPWKWFSATLNEATLSITGKQGLIRQVQFPKIVLPTAAVVAGTVSFVFGLVALGIVYVFYPSRLSLWILTIPIIAAVQFVFTIGVALIFAAANAFFRDIQNVLRHFLRMWFYLSPVLYSLDRIEKIHPSLHTILSLNPMAVLLNSYRSVTYGTSAPDWAGLLGRARVLVPPDARRRVHLQARRARLREDPLMDAAPSPTGAGSDVETAVEIRDLGIRYDLRLTKRTTLKGSLAGMLRHDPGRENHFWAIRHMSLSLAHGESMAIIGPNGAGKSTLLLAIAGILEPAEGTIVTRGKVSTLLTLGAGFENELTGRDNIDLAGAFLGIDQRQMDELTPSIIEFADIGEFIDAPVRTYSTGMRARLGFSIATAITPDILLLDEVLGTGDQTFRARSQARVRELVGKAKAIVLVTHDLSFVTEFCNRAILMEKGRIIHEGEPEATVDFYRQRVAEQKILAEEEAQRFARPPVIAPTS